jgi:hypothetical protein
METNNNIMIPSAKYVEPLETAQRLLSGRKLFFKSCIDNQNSFYREKPQSAKYIRVSK